MRIRYQWPVADDYARGYNRQSLDLPNLLWLALGSFMSHADTSWSNISLALFYPGFEIQKLSPNNGWPGNKKKTF